MSGCAASASVGSAVTRPARSSGTPSDCAIGDAATPAAHSTGAGGDRVPAADRHARHRRPRSRRTRCGPRRRAARASGAPPRAADPETARARYGPPFEQHDARRLRTDPAEILRAATGARSPRARRPVRRRSARLRRSTNVSRRRCATGVGFALGRLERQQHPPPHLERIVERLEARRARRPFRMTEVGVRRAGRQRSGSRSAIGSAAVDASRGAPPDRSPARRRAAPRRSSDDAGSSESATRCRRATATRSPPGTAAAGTDGSCGDRAA